ncbi:MAG: hypothetical protein HY323_17355 [Betaproteobacteria bacterium]|nr:hypothetical protein [Betaproteobacteria bacterium]
MKLLHLSLAAVVLAVVPAARAAAPDSAGAYPRKPIRMIVAPGARVE